MLTGLVAVPAAHAGNTRVSISNFAWSSPRVEIDLGEKVTWDWIGPDLAHSVTGISVNDLGWDSDPGTDAPSHRPGDSFTLQFSQPGAYAFQCKLHAFVRGEVVVSDVPGNPDSDPGPQAPLRLDVKKPTLGSVSPRRRQIHGRNGTATSAHVSERGTLEAEYFRLRPKGGRRYNGYATWKAFVGINRFALGAHAKHFRAKPGRYLVVLRTVDLAANASKPVRKRLEIVG
ncbi:MAG TPA: plastocyanin/azurin family copper-binding protein [Solirubrobacterales bacterium]